MNSVNKTDFRQKERMTSLTVKKNNLLHLHEHYPITEWESCIYVNTLTLRKLSSNVITITNSITKIGHIVIYASFLAFVGGK